MKQIVILVLSVLSILPLTAVATDAAVGPEAEAVQLEPASDSNRVAAEIDWYRLLGGRSLQRLKMAENSSVRETFSLCRDGRFYYSELTEHARTSPTSSFRANTRTTRNGLWRVVDNRLQLLWPDDSLSEYDLSARYIPQQHRWLISLDDERWSDRPARRCY